MADTVRPRILLVEDNGAISRLVGVILDEAGFDVHTAKTARDGVQAIAESSPDVVLLDLELPDFDGFRALEMMRSDPAGSDTPIVAFTSHAEAGMREQVEGAGFDGYISKPIVPDEFVRQIETYLAQD